MSAEQPAETASAGNPLADRITTADGSKPEGIRVVFNSGRHT